MEVWSDHITTELVSKHINQLEWWQKLQKHNFPLICVSTPTVRKCVKYIQMWYWHSVPLLICPLTHSSYQCEAAALLPRRTAVVGLLLTAALLGRCFSETAADSTTTGESHFTATWAASQRELMTNVYRLLSAWRAYLLLVGVIK